MLSFKISSCFWSYGSHFCDGNSTRLSTWLFYSFTIDGHAPIVSSLQASSPGRPGGGAQKEGELVVTSQEFEFLHRKSQYKMLIGGDEIS